MANRYSIASGLASATGTWDGGLGVPVDGDKVTITATHVVTLDGTYVWGDDTNAAINIFGTLSYSRIMNATLTAKGDVRVNSSGHFDMGTLASPIPSAYAATLLLNYSAVMAVQKWGIWYSDVFYSSHVGAVRKRITTLNGAIAAGATSITVQDTPTGWNIGDRLYICMTPVTNNVQFQQDIVTISSITGNVIGISATTYAHRDKTPLSNLESNVVIKPYDINYKHRYNVNMTSATPGDCINWAYASIENTCGMYPSWGVYFDGQTNYSGTQWPQIIGTFESCCLYKMVEASSGGTLIVLSPLASYDVPMPINNTAFICTSDATYNPTVLQDYGYMQLIDCLTVGGVYLHSSVGGGINRGWVSTDYGNGTIVNPTGRNYILDSVISVGTPNQTIIASDTAPGPINWEIKNHDLYGTFPRLNLGYGDGYGSVFGTQSAATNMSVTFTDTLMMDGADTVRPTLSLLGDQKVLTPDSFIKMVNKNQDVMQQEEWYRTGTLYRDNATTSRSTSSMKAKAVYLGLPFNKIISLPIANLETVRVIGYCKYDTTYYNGGTGFTAPTLTLSGTINGIALTPVVYTAAAANANNWHLIDVSMYNDKGADGILNLTFSQTPVVDNGLVYWDGICVPPIVTKARHYGFMFDEANQKRFVNGLISASESIAAVYTGITITWGTASSNISAIGVNHTFQELYDYTQAQSCLNINSSVPMTGAGSAGNPVLFAKGNITINTGFRLSGPGSVNMGAYVIASEFTGAVPYTYTGGTWSQASTIPTIAGGQLNIGVAGTYTFTMASSSIVSMTPTAPSTYNLSGGTYTGTLTLRNTSAHAITVQVPPGVSANSTGNTGGAITIDQSLLVTVRVTVKDSVTSSVLQDARVYLVAGAGGNLAEGTVIFNTLSNASGIVDTAAFAYTAPQPVVGRVRRSTISPFYKTSALAGTITTSGLDLTSLLTKDE